MPLTAIDLYKVFIEQAPNAIAMFNLDMKYIMTSRQWLIDYHLTDKEIIGKSHYEIFPEIGDDWKKIHQDCLQGSNNKCDEVSFHREDKTIQWISWEVRPWLLDSGAIGGIMMFTEDISHRKILQTELRIQEEQFRGAFNISAIGMAIVGLNGQWIKVNDALCKMLGYNKEHLYTLTFQDITHPDDLQVDLQLVNDLLNGVMDSFQLEKRYFNSKGEIIWGLLSVSIVRNEDRKPLHFVSQILDISESKKIAHIRLAEMDKNIARIAFELHENIAQAAASIKMLFAATSELLPENNNSKKINLELSALIKNVKVLSDQLAPTTFMQESLSSLISGLIANYNLAHNISTRLKMDENIGDIPFSSSYAIYRILEDLFKSAVLRRATELNVAISQSKMLSLEFSDNGRFQDPSGDNWQVNLLINNVLTRVEMLGGVFKNSDTVQMPGLYHISIPV
ncbi:MAG: PAS domain S-box protein [Flavitalea sp.]